MDRGEGTPQRAFLPVPPPSLACPQVRPGLSWHTRQMRILPGPGACNKSLGAALMLSTLFFSAQSLLPSVRLCTHSDVQSSFALCRRWEKEARFWAWGKSPESWSIKYDRGKDGVRDPCQIFPKHVLARTALIFPQLYLHILKLTEESACNTFTPSSDCTVCCEGSGKWDCPTACTNLVPV